MLYLGEEEVKSLVTMPEVVDLVDAAFQAQGRGIGTVPRHPRVIPRGPNKLGAFPVQTGERIEVVASSYLPRREGTIGGHQSQIVRGFFVGVMGLAYAKNPTPVGRDDSVRVANRRGFSGFRGDGPRISVGFLSEKSLVGVI